MSKTKQILLAVMLAIMGLPLSAQEKADTDFRFRFVAEKDMFFVPWSNNGQELERLLAAIAENRPAIEAGQIYLLVSSYGTIGNGKQSAGEVAKMRRNRVKSELIVRGGIKESNFVTDKCFSVPYGKEQLRHVVVVTLPASVDKIRQLAGDEAAARAQAYNYRISGAEDAQRQAAIQAQQAEEKRAQERAEQEQRIAREKAEQQRIAEEQRAAQKRAEQEVVIAAQQTERPPIIEETSPFTFNLRTNLLYWAAATPNIGVEWRINPSYGVKLDGGYSGWEYNGKDKIQKLWFINPEVRRYMLDSKRFYMGLGATVGEYNLKLGSTGYQGKGYGGALTAGYQLPMGKRFSWDFNIGLGAAHFTYDTFEVDNGVRVYKEKGCSKTLFTPTQIGVNLIWYIGNQSLKQ